MGNTDTCGYCWDGMFAKLVEYKHKHGGDTNVPQSHQPLGSWVNTQRTAYRKGKMKDYRTSVLVILGFNGKEGVESNKVEEVGGKTLLQRQTIGRRLLYAGEVIRQEKTWHLLLFYIQIEEENQQLPL